MTIHVLVVDNDPLQCRTAELTLHNKLGYDVSIANSGQEAVTLLCSKEGDNIDIVLLDLSMPEMSGIEVLKKVKPVRPDLPIVIHTAHGDVQKAVEALHEGAADFVEKKDGPERLKTCLENVIRLSKLQGQVNRLQRNIDGQSHFSDIIGSSNIIKKTKELAAKSASSNIPILIKGESGVGKEIFARAIHGSSQRSGKPFIAVNCGAIPENLVESVLFGHEKGSFTGAIEKTIGKFREAEGGTLFLDEIGELKPDIQVKILRAIQEREVEPVGASKVVNVDIRLISATNRNLKQDVASGDFREDLYYRINVFPFTIPPLKERKEDIIELLEFFTNEIATQENKPINGISDNAKKLLSEYSWPGNVRQLENAVYRAIVLCDNTHLDVRDFAHIISALYESNQEIISDDILESINQFQHNGNIPLSAIGESIRLINDDGDFKRFHKIEAEIIESALKFYDWKISTVARKLGIGRSTLYRKMHEYDINQEPEDKDAA